MKYDVAIKTVFKRCLKHLLKSLCKLDISECEDIERKPEETTSLRRLDLAAQVTFKDGKKALAVVEYGTRWTKTVALKLLEYRTRYKFECDLDIISIAIVLTRGAEEMEIYRDNEVEYRYKLVRIYELSAREVIKSGITCLYPFVPLMKDGIKYSEEADRKIYEAEEFGREEKADLLTGMAIFAGLISKDLTEKLIERRRDIMVESAAYELIKEEGRKEGRKKGKREKTIEIAKNMLELGADIEFVVRTTGLS